MEITSRHFCRWFGCMDYKTATRYPALPRHSLNVIQTPEAGRAMHELAIAESIVDAVETRAIACTATRVKCVRLRIGEANGIVSDSLTFCFEMLTSQVPLLAGAQLAIDTLPHRAWCPRCEREFAVIDYVAQCPVCQEWSTTILSGTELQIQDMEIEIS